MSKKSRNITDYICDNCNIKISIPKRHGESLTRYHASEDSGKKDLYADDPDLLWVTLVFKKVGRSFNFEYKNKDFCCAACAKEFLKLLTHRDKIIQKKRKTYVRNMGHFN